LDRPLITRNESADNESEPRILAKVRRLSGRAQRVEYDFKLVGDGDADHCSLRVALSGH
jgi:hypothetical protein